MKKALILLVLLSGVCWGQVYTTFGDHFEVNRETISITCDICGNTTDYYKIKYLQTPWMPPGDPYYYRTRGLDEWILIGEIKVHMICLKNLINDCAIFHNCKERDKPHTMLKPDKNPKGRLIPLMPNYNPYEE